jgi:hypothetical protein
MHKQIIGIKIASLRIHKRRNCLSGEKDSDVWFFSDTNRLKEL